MKPLLVSLYLMIFEQISGFNAIIFYTNDIFIASGRNVDSHLATIIVGIIQVLATIVSTVLVDKAGRRILLLFSEIVMAVALFAFSGFFYIQKYSSTATVYISWLPILSLCVFVIAFAIGIGPLSWTIMSEILPPNAKGNTKISDLGDILTLYCFYRIQLCYCYIRGMAFGFCGNQMLWKYVRNNWH